MLERETQQAVQENMEYCRMVINTAQLFPNRKAEYGVFLKGTKPHQSLKAANPQREKLTSVSVNMTVLLSLLMRIKFRKQKEKQEGSLSYPKATEGLQTEKTPLRLNGAGWVYVFTPASSRCTYRRTPSNNLGDCLSTHSSCQKLKIIPFLSKWMMCPSSDLESGCIQMEYLRQSRIERVEIFKKQPNLLESHTNHMPQVVQGYTCLTKHQPSG